MGLSVVELGEELKPKVSPIEQIDEINLLQRT